MCTGVLRIIHSHDVKACNECGILNVDVRRQFLAMKLFEEALCSTNHVLHHLLPQFSHHLKRLISSFARTKKKTDEFVISCSKLYNARL